MVLSPRLYIYDMRDDFDKERLREKLKEAAEFIPRHIKGWLLPARDRAAWEDDEWAGMGDFPPGFIVDTDPKSETYKRLIPYWPHIEKVKEYFQLYRELGGETSLVYKHLRVSPVVFPEFEQEVDRINVSRFKLTKYPGGGYYIKSKTAIIALLTQPLYWGYRAIKGVIRRDEQGNKIRSHEPVIDIDLLEFAYNRLAKTDFDGNPIENQSKRRFFHRRHQGTTKQWSDEELSILYEHYATMPKAQLMALLPNRGWDAILWRAGAKGLLRPRGRPKGETIGGDKRNSYTDREFMRKKNISEYANHTNWEQSY